VMLGALGNAAAESKVIRMQCVTGCMQTDLADGAVGLQEVGLQEGVKQIAGHALDGVVDGQHMDALAVLDIGALQPRQQRPQEVIRCNTEVSYDMIANANSSCEQHCRLCCTWCTDTTSASRTRRFLRTTLLMRILDSSTVSSASTMHTVSFRFFPWNNQVKRHQPMHAVQEMQT
jgi:hypothetical protein